MKKQKIKLRDIEISSFVTNMSENEKMTIHAGEGSWWISGCLLTLRCPDEDPAKPADNFESKVWTLSPAVGLCQTGQSRNIISQLDAQQCPACARPRQNAPIAPAQN